MKKKFFLALSILALTASLRAAEVVPAAGQIRSLKDLPQVDQLDSTARQGADRFRGMLNSKNSQKMGFASAGEVSQSQLGRPIRHYFVRLDYLRAYQPGQDPRNLLDSRSTVTYPLMAGDDAKSGVGLIWKDNQWKVASLGASSIVKRWHGKRQRHAQALGVDSGDFFTVRVNALNLEFFGYYDAQSRLILIAEDDEPSLGLKEGQSQPADQLFLKLVPKAVAHGDKSAS
jgi:hypothetical protein